MTAAYVAFGGNLGDVEITYAAAAHALRACHGVICVRPSSLYRTASVGGPAGSASYLNGCYEIENELEPDELFAHIFAVETALGRVRTEHWGPRTIDLDLALFGDRIVASERLTVPHPRMHFRRFVLDPLVELAPSARHPMLGRSVQELSNSVRDPNKLIVVDGAKRGTECNSVLLGTSMRRGATPSHSGEAERAAEYAWVARRIAESFPHAEAVRCPASAEYLNSLEIGVSIVGAAFWRESAQPIGPITSTTWAVMLDRPEPMEIASVRSEHEIIPAIDCRATNCSTPEEELEFFLRSIQETTRLG